MISDGIRPMLQREQNGWWRSDSPTRLSQGCCSFVLIFQEFLDVSQIAMAFHKIRPTLFIEIGTSTAEVPSLTLRTARSAMPWTVLSSSQDFLNSNVLSVYITFGFCDDSKNFLKLFCFLRSFCFARITLNPLRGKILQHDSVSIIASRFTFLVEDFVISCYQVTKLFCSKCGFAVALSAKRPCHLGSRSFAKRDN